MSALAGSVALVTGAGRGIGRAVSLGLAEKGADLVLVARTRDELEQVAAEVRELGRDALVISADVTDEAQVIEAVATACDWKPVDICVNNAGTNRPGPTVDLTAENWHRMLETNLTSTFLVCREVGRQMLAGEVTGRIVNMSSQMGSVGYPGRAGYCASKHAINGLTKALAVEWAPHGITVNAVAPTFVHTPMTAPMFEDQAFKEDVLRRIPGGRLAQLEDVVAAVVYLASADAGMVNGHILLVDGGWVAW